MNKLSMASSLVILLALAGCNDNSKASAKAEINQANQSVKTSINDLSAQADTAQKRIDEAAKAVESKTQEIKQEISDAVTSKPRETLRDIDVAPKLVECVGVTNMQCMSVKEVGSVDWQNYYGTINGFNFEPGNSYRLKVKETLKTNVPADASSRQWDLVEVVSKTPVSQ